MKKSILDTPIPSMKTSMKKSILDTPIPNLWGKLKSPFSDSSSKEKPKRTPCPQAVKEAVWKKYFGNTMIGKCYVCKAEITFTNFELGHNKPHSKGGEWVVSNLRPLCRTCNRSMGDKMTVEAFKKKYFGNKSKATPTQPKKTTKTKTRAPKSKKK